MVLDRSALYETARLELASADEIPELLEELDGGFHVFCITVDASFHSPSPATVADLKLGVLPLYSTGFSRSKLARALALIGSTDYGLQYDRSRRLVEDLDGAERLILQSARFGTIATLELWLGPGPIHFFSQSGAIRWGGQSVLPGGEVSLLTDGHGEYSRESTFALDGELVIRGMPVLHRGTCPCALARACALLGAPRVVVSHPAPRPTAGEQAALFQALEPVARSAAALSIAEGVVCEIRSLGSDHRFVAAFERLLVEEDYRKVHEIGFGLNNHEPLAGENFLPNEMVSGIHFGFGLTPYTGFHLDLISLEVDVIAETKGRRKAVLPAR